MKRATFAASAVALVAALALTGCSNENLTFSIADTGSASSTASNTSNVTEPCEIDDATVSKIMGTDMGEMFEMPYNINESSQNTHSCVWQTDDTLVSITASHRPVIPDQIFSCHIPPVRGDQKLSDLGNPGWWTFSSDNVGVKGVINACDGSKRVHVKIVDTTDANADESAIKDEAEQFARLALESLSTES